MSVRNFAKRVAKNAFVASGALRLARRLADPAAVILRYHSIQDRPEEYANTIGCDAIHATSIFERHMELLARRFSPVSMDDVLLFLQGKKSLPRRAVAVTFDDGYKDNFRIAAPILTRYGIPGTFYVLVDSVDRSKAPWYCRLRQIMFTTCKGRRAELVGPVDDPNDYSDLARVRVMVHEGRDSTRSDSNKNIFLTAAEVCARASATERDNVIRMLENSLQPEPFPAESDLMMTFDDARALAKSGHIVGSHTMTHPNVAHISADEARGELTESKHKLELELGEPVRHFSYPHPALYPQWSETTWRITEELGYSTAVTTTCGGVRANADPLTLPRTYVPREETEFLWNTERTFLVRPHSASHE